MKLNLFIVGAGKCGTTFLRNLLRTHPKIQSKNGELHYFDLHYGHKNYIQKFYNFNPKFKYFLDSSPSYSIIKPVAQRIYNYNSNSKIIFCVRNHEERILSHINMMKQIGREGMKLIEIINNEITNIKEDVISYNPTKYIKRTLYYEQIKRYIEQFGKNNVYIFNLDNYNLDDLYKFLDIENNNYNINKIFKREGVPKIYSEIEFLKSHKGLQNLISADKLLLKQDYNIVI